MGSLGPKALKFESFEGKGNIVVPTTIDNLHSTM